MQSTIRRYRMDRRQISFIKFILEAYDNLAIVSTVDADKAVIEIRIAPGCEGEVADLLDSFAGQVKITPIGQQEQHHGGGTERVTRHRPPPSMKKETRKTLLS